MKTTHKTQKTLRAIIISNFLILSLLTLSSCSDEVNLNLGTYPPILSSEGEDDVIATVSDELITDNEITTISVATEAETENPEAAITLPKQEYGYDCPDITLPSIVAPTDDKYKDTLLPEEIEYCINKLSNGFVIEGFEYDIDFDGNNELLCPFSGLGMLKIFKKSDNVICEKTAEGDGFHYVDAENLKTLQTFEDENEKYAYFYYDYDGGVMKCNVLTAIKYDGEKDMYTVENIMSWGKLDYGEGEASKDSRPFFRKGWSSLDRAPGQSKCDISQEEFFKIYSKYENLPEWDEYLNQE